MNNQRLKVIVKQKEVGIDLSTSLFYASKAENLFIRTQISLQSSYRIKQIPP